MHAQCHYRLVLQAVQSRAKDEDQNAERQLTALLTVPLDKYNVVTVLGLSHYPSVMNLLPPATKKVSLQLADSRASLLGSSAM